MKDKEAITPDYIAVIHQVCHDEGREAPWSSTVESRIIASSKKHYQVCVNVKNMKRILSLRRLLLIGVVPFVCCSGSLFAQTSQNGFVKEYNERLDKTPLGNVELLISNAPSTMTDANGAFMLEFRTLKPGDKVNVRRIEKLGYEIFNKEALEQWYISRNGNPFTIIMCKSDRFKRIRDNYSRVSSESYEKQLKKEEARLEAERKDGRLKQTEYEAALKKLNDEYDRQLENLDNYVDHFARIDLSELSEAEAEIIGLVQNGEIEKAIKLYEEQNLEEKYRNQVEVIKKTSVAIDTLMSIKAQSGITRDSLFAAIKRKNEMRKLAGGQDNFEEIEKSLKGIALADTTNEDALWEYAIFANQQTNYKDAIKFFAIFSYNCQDDNKNVLAQIRIADSYRKLKRYDECKLYISKAFELTQKLAGRNYDAYQDLLAQVHTSRALMAYENNNLNEAEKDFVDVNSIYTKLCTDSTESYLYKLSKAQNNLGNLYRRTRHFEEAEKYMLLSLQNTEKLFLMNSDKYLFDLASTRNNLGLIYKTLHDNGKAEDCYRQSIKEMEQLMNYDPKAYREEYLKYLSNMGVLLKNIKRYEEAELYYIKVISHADTLCSSNYEAYSMYLGNSILNLGNLYIKMNRLNDAKDNLLRSLPIIQGLYKRSPDTFRVSLLSVNISLGDVLIYLKQYKDAESYLLEALSLSETLYKANPRAFAEEYKMTLNNLSILYTYLENSEKAEYFNLKVKEMNSNVDKE